jgi:serine/threonine protein kinase/tetratricopeptide (TPR) repeat protein
MRPPSRSTTGSRPPQKSIVGDAENEPSRRTPRSHSGPPSQRPAAGRPGGASATPRRVAAGYQIMVARVFGSDDDMLKRRNVSEPTNPVTNAGTAVPEGLGPYRIERQLGRGGMGEVFLARDERLGRAVAVKRIRSDAPPAAEARRRLRREARAVARLNHPAVVQVYDVLEAAGHDWIVLEYVPGTSLAELASDGGLAAAQALALGRQIAEGLAHAHERGILHRDLKAENVRVTPDGRAKILDLGLAKSAAERTAGDGDEDGSLTVAGGLVGTPRAMAPEQVAGGTVDHRADLFSFGVLLYELFAGRSPFQAPSAAATLRRVLAERPVPLRQIRPELPRELSDLVAELLAAEPAERPAGAAEAARRLAAVAELPEIAVLGPPAQWLAVPGMSEAPTAEKAPRPGVPQRLPAARAVRRRRPASAANAADGAPLHRWPARRTAAGAATAAALGAAAISLVALRFHATDPPLVLAVLPPAVAWSGEGAGQAAAIGAAVHAALLDSLASTRGVLPLDASEVDAAPPSPTAAARATAADEVLRSLVSCDAGECQVVLHRLDGDGGRVLATSRPFVVPAQPEDRLALANAVGVQLRRQLYPEAGRGEEVGGLDVRDADYVAYLEVRRRLEEGQTPRPEDPERLAELARSSPRFLEGWLLAARVNRALGRLEEADDAALAAETLAPDDPRPLAERIDLAVARGRHDEAETLLGELARRAPGDQRVARARVRLHLAGGRFGEAVAAAHELVARRPSWRNLWDLANAQMLANERPAAEQTLEELLRISPGNRWGLAKRAELEVFCDRLDAAAATYHELLEVAPLATHLRNLAWIELLRGRHAAAIDAGRRALDLDPAHARTRLNLALAHDGLGQTAAAGAIYRQLVDESSVVDGAADPTDGLLRAQSEVRLGRPRDAVRTVRQVLSATPQADPQVLYMAAQVFALAGERLSALDAAERALAAGIGVRWFAVPAFDALSDGGELRALLDGHAGRCGGPKGAPPGPAGIKAAAR